MNTALLSEFYQELNASRNLERFARKVRERYTEGTLQRLLISSEPRVRQAALTALSLIGTMRSNDAVAECLYDENRQVCELAESTLWSLWFRGDTLANNKELQRLVQLIKDEEYAKALAGLNALTAKAPQFAEAYNQRAILYWQQGEFKKSILDCEEVLKRNPHHFGAQTGMAQCYLHLKRPGEALKALRQAHKVNPNMAGLEERIQELELLLKQRGRTQD